MPLTKRQREILTYLSEYAEEPNLSRPSWPERHLGSGSIALQGHNPTDEVDFRNIKIRQLP